jgi:hypothetical protein
MLTVSSALVCLDCDTLFNEQDECPKCLSASYYPLRKWLAPLVSFGEIREAKKNGHKTEFNNIQEKREEAVLFANNNVRVSLAPEHHHFTIGSGCLPDIPSDNAKRFVSDYIPTSPKHKSGEGNYYSGEPLESEGGFKRGSHWAHAGYARIRTFVSRHISIRPLLSGEEHYCGNKNTEVLPANKPKS